MTSINVTTAKTAELVAFYNANSGKPAIKKFADRKTAEIRVTDLVATMKPVAKKVSAASPVAANRSEAISKTWADPKVKEARSTRTHVKAAGKVFRSVKEAFEELGLPLSKHIKFRMELKQHAQLTFTNPADGKKITFSVAQE